MKNIERQHIAVVGAGISGLTSALALSRRGHRVSVLDRDIGPPEGHIDDPFVDWQRRGAAQFRHAHAFLGMMCIVLEDHYPDVLQAYLDAGARKFDFKELLPKHLLDAYVFEPGDEELWWLQCRRSTIETVLRRIVAGSNNVEILNRQRVTGLMVEQSNCNQNDIARNKGPLVVTGIQRDKDQPFSADVVIDATGANSKFPRWLAQLGVEVGEERSDAEIVYYTRHYRLKEGASFPTLDATKPGTGDLGFLRYGVFPGDNGNFAFVLCFPSSDLVLKRAIRCGATFDAICQRVPGMQLWIGDKRAEPTTDPIGIGEIHAFWRHYVRKGVPLTSNFFAVGDSAVRTNPLYGQGCSTGTVHAHLLANVLDETSDPVKRARSFAKRTKEELRPIYDIDLAEDRRSISRSKAHTEKHPAYHPKSIKARLFTEFGEALAAAAHEHIHVNRGLNRTINLVDRPGQFLNSAKVWRTIFRYLLRGRKRNSVSAARPKLTREEAIGLTHS